MQPAVRSWICNIYFPPIHQKKKPLYKPPANLLIPVQTAGFCAPHLHRLPDARE